MQRSYCNRKDCKPNECRYLHRGRGKMLPIDFNRRVKKVNNAVSSLFKFDDRFKDTFKFLDYFSEIDKLGSITNSYGNFLSDDGLHLSHYGNELLDKWLFDYLQGQV